MCTPAAWHRVETTTTLSDEPREHFARGALFVDATFLSCLLSGISLCSFPPFHLNQVTLSKSNIFSRTLFFRLYAIFSPSVTSAVPLKMGRQASLSSCRCGRVWHFWADGIWPQLLYLSIKLAPGGWLPEWHQKSRCVASDLSPSVAWHPWEAQRKWTTLRSLCCSVIPVPSPTIHPTPPMAPKAPPQGGCVRWRWRQEREGWISPWCASCLYPLITNKLFFASTEASINSCHSFLTIFGVEVFLLKEALKRDIWRYWFTPAGSVWIVVEGKTVAELLIN